MEKHMRKVKWIIALSLILSMNSWADSLVINENGHTLVVQDAKGKTSYILYKSPTFRLYNHNKFKVKVKYALKSHEALNITGQSNVSELKEGPSVIEIAANSFVEIKSNLPQNGSEINLCPIDMYTVLRETQSLLREPEDKCLFVTHTLLVTWSGNVLTHQGKMKTVSPITSSTSNSYIEHI
jgi:hypothetical protein